MSVPVEPCGALLDRAQAAPLVEIGELAPPGALLLIIPHPDDETLGCGMALAAAADLGREIMLVLVTDGEGSHPNSRAFSSARLRSVRREELQIALAVLTGGRSVIVERLALPDGRSDPAQVEEGRLSELERAARARGTSSIWTTWREDPHCDHHTAALIAIELSRRLALPLWQFPVWGRFGDVGALPCNLRCFCAPAPIFAERKRLAIRAYRSQFTHLISDDPSAFVMPPALLAHFEQHPELFIGE